MCVFSLFRIIGPTTWIFRVFCGNFYFLLARLKYKELGRLPLNEMWGLKTVYIEILNNFFDHKLQPQTECNYWYFVSFLLNTLSSIWLIVSSRTSSADMTSQYATKEKRCILQMVKLKFPSTNLVCVSSSWMLTGIMTFCREIVLRK